jgi:predicted HTH domain antitoxin
MKQMERQILVTYPESLAFSLKMGNREFENEMKTISVVKLYEMGKISSGKAAELLKVTRLAFLNLLSLYNVSFYHSTKEELKDDFANA